MYCSLACQTKHWSEHKKICKSIVYIQKQGTPDIKDSLTGNVYRLSPKSQYQIAKLVGKSCTIECKMNGKTVTVLWDTGAQVSVVSTNWWKEYFPNAGIQPLDELVNGSELKILAANGTQIPYDGYVDCELVIGQYEVRVPLLVTPELGDDRPILGYNVIELCNNMCFQNEHEDSNMNNVFPGLSKMDGSRLSDVLRDSGRVCGVKTSKKSVVIARGSCRVLRLSVSASGAEGMAIFEPSVEGFPEGLVIRETLVKLKRGSH